jgi:hypothetical protein
LNRALPQRVVERNGQDYRCDNCTQKSRHFLRVHRDPSVSARVAPILPASKRGPVCQLIAGAGLAGGRLVIADNDRLQGIIAKPRNYFFISQASL